MTKQENLLNKYYKGNTSIEEEKVLKAAVLESEKQNHEKLIFEYFDCEAKVPEALEEDLFAGIEKQFYKRKSRVKYLYSLGAAAAVVFVLLSVFVDFRNTKRTQMEDNFFVMEQALFQVSECLQPPNEMEEMLVLWVDDDVEIIIN